MLAALALCATSAPLGAEVAGPKAAASASLTLSVQGQRSTRGQLLVCITANAGAFPDCSRDPAATRLIVPLEDAAALRASLPAGRRYAIAVVHDENGNGRMDKLMGIPREGFGFSRDPALRMGPPRFDSAAFRLDGPDTESIRLRYML